MLRISRHEMFLQMAELAAQRGTCERLHPGCIIVGNSDNKITISMGYTSSYPDTPHCSEAGCLMEDGHCVRCIHAEEAAITQYRGNTSNLAAYITHTPCLKCYKLLTSFGVNRILIREKYGEISEAYQTMINLIGVELVWKTP